MGQLATPPPRFGSNSPIVRPGKQPQKSIPAGCRRGGPARPGGAAVGEVVEAHEQRQRGALPEGEEDDALDAEGPASGVVRFW